MNSNERIGDKEQQMFKTFGYNKIYKQLTILNARNIPQFCPRQEQSE